MTWAVAEAKAKFSEVLDKAETAGPQVVTRRKREYIVLTREEWDRRRLEPLHNHRSMSEFSRTRRLPAPGLNSHVQNRRCGR
jgi:prevent-host-death family protein